MSTKKNEKQVSMRKKSVLLLKVKIEMLDRLRLRESFAPTSRSFNVNESTVQSIKNQTNTELGHEVNKAIPHILYTYIS